MNQLKNKNTFRFTIHLTYLKNDMIIRMSLSLINFNKFRLIKFDRSQKTFKFFFKTISKFDEFDLRIFVFVFHLTYANEIFVYN